MFGQWVQLRTLLPMQGTPLVKKYRVNGVLSNGNLAAYAVLTATDDHSAMQAGQRVLGDVPGIEIEIASIGSQYAHHNLAAQV